MIQKTAAVAGIAMMVTIIAAGGGSPLKVSAVGATPAVQKVGEIPTPYVNGHAGSYAWGAATMPDGSVIIGDIWNRRVLHYDTAGNLLGTLFTVTTGDAPYGLAVDKRNSVIYVGRPGPNGVERWVPNGGTYTEQGVLRAAGMKYPSRVAVANDGDVYITDQLAPTMWVFNGDTQKLLMQFGSLGAGPGQFRQPRGLAFDQSTPQRLYVMDSGNERVQVFARGGSFPWSLTYLSQFGSNGSGPDQFHGENTRGLAIDTTRGLIFVTDIAANTIHKFDLSGNWIANIGHGDKSTFPSPVGTFTQGGRELAVTTGSDGTPQLWVGDMPNFRLQVFNEVTRQVIFAAPDPAVLPPVGGFNDPRGVTVDSSGNTYVADTHNFRLEKFDSTGKVVWAIGNRGGAINADSLAYSRNMAADPSQPYFYLADTYNSVIDKYTTDGIRVWQAGGLGSGQGQLADPSGVGVAAANHNVYVADSQNRRIQILEPSAGAVVGTFKCTPCTDPRGVAVDPGSGDVYIADMDAALLEFSRTGAYMRTLASKGTGTGQLETASDVVLDSNYVYVTDSKAEMVKLFSLADGSYVTSIGGLRLPSAAAVNPVTHNLVVAEEYGERLSLWCVSC